jgi:very-short-patch-repair endonuclease
MRVAPTDSEAAVWRLLSGSKLGVAFKRQVVIGRYIVDFCAPSIKLIVEVDGGYQRERAKADARRQRELEALGYTVVRVRVG